MKITVNKKDLHETLLKNGIILSKPSLPILGTVLLKASFNKLSLFTTDLEISVSTTIPVETEEEGEICLPLRKLIDILQEAEDKAAIFIETDETNNIILSQKNYTFKLTGIKSEEFPPFPKIEWETKISLKADSFKDLIKKTSYAAATGDTRFALNGVSFSLVSEENKLIAAATDGHRLAINSVDLEEKVEKSANFILPKRFLEDLLRIIKDEEIKIFFSPNYARFCWNTTEITSRLIEDVFPEYKSVLPKERKNKWYVDKESLLRSCRRISVMTSERMNMIKFLFSSTKGNRMYASTVGVGEAEERIPSSYEGEDLEIAFNPNFIIDAIKNLEDKELTLQFGDISSSMLLVSKDGNYTAVIMPMRL